MAGLSDLISDPFTPYIAENEGYRDTIYRDTKGKRTIGYGFNLDDPTVAQLIPAEVLLGKRPITKDESLGILSVLKDRAVGDAKSIVGEDVFNSMSPQQQVSFVDMSYNLGKGKLSGFQEMRKALVEKDWERAGKELLNSKYATEDVPNRAKRNAQAFGIANEPSPLKQMADTVQATGQVTGEATRAERYRKAFRDAANKGLNEFDFEGQRHAVKFK